MPRTAGGTALNNAPSKGSWSRPVRCSTTGIPAPSSTECAGRAPVVVSSMLTESMPTRATPPSTSARAGPVRCGCDRVTVGGRAPVPAPAGSQQYRPPGHVEPLEGLRPDRAARVDHKRLQMGAPLERQAGQVVAAAIAVGRGVQVGTGVGHHRDRSDGELRAGLVGPGRGLEAQVLGDLRRREAPGRWSCRARSRGSGRRVASPDRLSRPRTAGRGLGSCILTPHAPDCGHRTADVTQRTGDDAAQPSSSRDAPDRPDRRSGPAHSERRTSRRGRSGTLGGRGGVVKLGQQLEGVVDPSDGGTSLAMDQVPEAVHPVLEEAESAVGVEVESRLAPHGRRLT